MSLQEGDLRFVRSLNMNDVPEGGGAPSDELLESGQSNEMFDDIPALDRINGRASIVQVFSTARNPDTDKFLGSHTIIAEPPADPNVSVVMLSLKNSFATRKDIVERIESGMSVANEFNGYLMENHNATSKQIRIFQTPLVSPPAIGKTFVLVYDEGKSSERRERVRIKSVDVEIRKFRQQVLNTVYEFDAQVCTCEIFDGLRNTYPGSMPDYFFVREQDKTIIRETVYSDSGMFYSASRLTAPVLASDTWLQVGSVYAQLVPNTRTEVASVNQNPSARRTIKLADSPRLVEVGQAAHTIRLKITEENQGLVYVVPRMLPLPQLGTVIVDYTSLGQRYTAFDDETGALSGAAGGNVSSLTGDLAITLQRLPDIGTNIAVSWGAPVAFTDRRGQAAQVKAPKITLVLDADNDSDQAEPGSLVLKYTSANVVYTVTDNGAGKLQGEATGVIDYPSRTVVMEPSRMPDAGAELAIDYRVHNTVTEFVTPSVDAAGFAAIALAQQPAAGTVQCQWAVARSVSNTSGATLSTVSTNKDAATTYVNKLVPEFYEPDPEVVPPSTPFRPGFVALHTDTKNG